MGMVIMLINHVLALLLIQLLDSRWKPDEENTDYSIDLFGLTALAERYSANYHNKNTHILKK